MNTITISWTFICLSPFCLLYRAEMCLEFEEWLTRFCGFKLLIVLVENMSAKASFFRHGVSLSNDTPVINGEAGW